MFKNPFLREAWVEFGIGLVVIFCRLCCRYRVVGWRWDGDDFFSVAAAILWTAEMSMIYFSTKLGTIANMTDEIALTLTDEQKSLIIAGSKFLFAAWCVYISLIWSLKACMLFLYGRLTLDLKQRDMVKICAILCGITYVAAILATFTHCTPLHRKWQVYPYPGEACAVYVPNFYVVTVTNAGTELLIACIPIPLLWKVRMSWPKKSLCCLWLCTGVCMIVATLLRCILSLRDIHIVNLTTIWSARETFIGIIGVNVPILGPFIAHTVSRLSGLKSRNSSKPGGKRDGSVPPPEAGGHRLSIMERRAKQERIRRGMRWTTFDGASDEDIAKDEYEMHSIFSTRTTNDTHSSLRVGCGSTYV